jgi:hypothetical protein
MAKRNSELSQIADRVRAQLKAELPECKFSVTTTHFSGGRELRISLSEAPFQMFNDPELKHAQLNEYQFGEGKTGEGISCLNNGERLTPQGWEVMNKASIIGQAENWDKSDPQSDYFNVNYWFHIAVGQWDKPYKIVAKTTGKIPSKTVTIQAPDPLDELREEVENNPLLVPSEFQAPQVDEEEEITPTLNPVTAIPGSLKAGDRLGFKVIAVIGGTGDWAAYRGLTSQSDDEIARQGDKIEKEAAEALFYAPKAAGLTYRGW